jgi:hypothetical protein
MINGYYAISPNTTADFFTITFVGTGLDVMYTPGGLGGTLSTYTVSVDGGTAASITFNSALTSFAKLSVASGLPYGTHTVKFICTALGTTRVYWSNFIIYGPSKPAIPAGSVELADYYVLGNYAASSVATVGFMPPGVLRKVLAVREALYTGTWSIGLDAANFESGASTQAGASSSSVSYTFFGTGFEWSQFVFTNAMNATYSIDGSTNFSGFTTSLLQTSSGLSFTASTGVLNGTSAASGRIRLLVSGLSLGLHTIKFTTNNSNQHYAECLDIITPVHSPKSNLPGDLQNTLLVGSNALGDSRLLPEQTVKPLSNWAQAVGVSGNPTTTSGSFTPMPDMSCVIKTSGNPIRVSFTAELVNSGAANGLVAIYVDGALAPSPDIFVGGTSNIPISLQTIIPLSAGVHIVQIYWRTDGGTETANATRRILTVGEL